MALVSPRMTFPHRLYKRVEIVAERWGIDPADVMELTLTAGLPTEGRKIDDEADFTSRLCRRFEADEALDMSPLSDKLAGHKVGLLRMGPVVTEDAGRSIKPGTDDPSLEGESQTGYPRAWMGMSVSDSALEVWQASRGYWRLKKDLRYLVPTRFGYAPYVFKVEDWIRYNSTKFYASSGWLIYPEAGVRRQLIEPVDGEHLCRLGEPEAAEDADLTVGQMLGNQLLRLGPRGTNPVIRL